MPALCPDGTHKWFYPTAEDFCITCGLHQMDREDAIELEMELLSQPPVPVSLVWVPVPLPIPAPV